MDETTKKAFIDVFGVPPRTEPLSDFEQLLEPCALAAARAFDALMLIADAQSTLESALQRAGDAHHHDPHAKATTMAVWRATVEQLKAVRAAVSL